MSKKSQLSFEEDLYKWEGDLLVFASKLTALQRQLHYQRTMMTATMSASRSSKVVAVLNRSRRATTGSLDWLSEIQYLVGKEINSIRGLTKKELHEFKAPYDADHLIIPEEMSSPFQIYTQYLRIYKQVSQLVDHSHEITHRISSISRLIKEFYQDMQVVGEELEEIL